MDIAELRAFVAIAESGSIKGAAAAMACPRATIRRRLKALETRLDAPLVVRSADGAHLTRVGLRVLDRARSLLRDADQLISAAAGTERIERLCARVPVGMPPRMVGRFMRAIGGLLPGTRFELVYDSAQPVEAVIQIGAWTDPGWRSYTLMQIREWLVASPRYLAQHGRPTAVSDLHAHALLTWRPPDRRPDQWPLLDDSLVPVKPAIIHEDIHIVRHMAAAGMGIALVPDAEIDETESDIGPLEVVLDDVVGHTLPVTLAIHPTVADHPAFAATAGLIAQLSDEI